MKFRLEIECDNAAFSDDPYEEVALILADAAKHVRRSEWTRSLSDENGNRVGHYEFIE
jgi:hypothetical protein